jgi:cellulase/cellobiase CelA1
MIALGSKVRDNITGFTGIATGRTVWLYGCERICIEPQELKDGKPIDAAWFDDQRVELVEESAPQVSPQSSATSGGPQRDPSRRPGG